jgi:hypothetical protein
MYELRADHRPARSHQRLVVFATDASTDLFTAPEGTDRITIFAVTLGLFTHIAPHRNDWSKRLRLDAVLALHNV